MKLAIFLVTAIVGAAYARPQEPGLVRFDLTPEGYSYSFATDDQISKQENGKLLNPGQENEYIAVDGTYSYVGLDGKQVTVTYVADENGFRPKFVIGGNPGPQQYPAASIASLAG